MSTWMLILLSVQRRALFLYSRVALYEYFMIIICQTCASFGVPNAKLIEHDLLLTSVKAFSYYKNKHVKVF